MDVQKKIKNYAARIFGIFLFTVTAALCSGSSTSFAAYENTHRNTGNMTVDIVEIAKTQIGYKEGSGNYTKYGVWYPYQGGKGAWCAMFVSWCANQAGIPTSIVPKHCNCTAGMNWFKNNSRWKVRGSHKPQPGDIIYFGSTASSNHVGIVESADGTSVRTIEGNASNQCKRNTYRLTNTKIVGYGTPSYNSQSVPENPSAGGELDTRYPCPLKSYTVPTVRVTTYSSVGGGVTGYISGDADECTINEIYTNGWVKVTYPISKGTKTAYCPLAEFIRGGERYNVYAAENVAVFKRPNLSESYGTIYPSDIIMVVGQEGNSLQVIYPTSNNCKMGWIDANAVTAVEKDNIGTDFYALIINSEVWRHLTNQQDNVDSCTERGDASQVWHFKRWEDGSYKITSTLDGKVLDVANGSSELEANVQVYDDNGTDAQRWVIDQKNNGYYLSAKCTKRCVLDLAQGLPDEHTNLIMYSFHGRGPQLFQIYNVNPVQDLQTTKQNITMAVGDSYGFKQDIIYTPAEPYNKNLAFTSDNKSVATVDSEGRILGVSSGKTVIKGKSVDGLNKTVSVQVEVKKPEEKPEEPSDTKDYTVSIGSAEARKGEVIEVPVKIHNNKGLMGLSAKITYNGEALKNVAAEAGEVLKRGSYDTSINDKTGGEFKILWNHSENVTSDGTLFTTKFQVADTCPQGEYPIQITFNEEDTFNEQYQGVELNVAGGNIVVKESPKVIVGDVNEDKVVNNKDVVVLLRYMVGKETMNEGGKAAADVNHDGLLNNKDAAKLSRYLVGKESLK